MESVELVELIDFVGNKVRYIKHGTRYNWIGTITDINSENLTVVYENGIEQTYSINALIIPPMNHEDVGDYCAYLLMYKENKLEKQKHGKISRGDYLVVDLKNSSVVSVEETKEEAELFATEQATDTGNTYVVYEPAIYTTVKPLYEKIIDYFKK